MRSEIVRKLLLESQYFGGLIQILFAALIATDPEGATENRARVDGVGLGKGNSMPVEKVYPKMSPMVLAEHHPDVMAIGPHFFLYGSLPACFAGSSRRRCGRDACIVSSSCARRRTGAFGENPHTLRFSRRFLILNGVRAPRRLHWAASGHLTSDGRFGLSLLKLLPKRRPDSRLEAKENEQDNRDTHGG